MYSAVEYLQELRGSAAGCSPSFKLLITWMFTGISTCCKAVGFFNHRYIKDLLARNVKKEIFLFTFSCLSSGFNAHEQ